MKLEVFLQIWGKLEVFLQSFLTEGSTFTELGDGNSFTESGERSKQSFRESGEGSSYTESGPKTVLQKRGKLPVLQSQVKVNSPSKSYGTNRPTNVVERSSFTVRQNKQFQTQNKVTA